MPARAHDLPLSSPLWALVKRLVDVLGALGALIIFSPVFIVLALLIRRDGGPAFYGHTRIGKNGVPFKCWKFRSMVRNSEDVLKDLLAKDPAAKAEWEKDFKLRNDPRITKVGDFLRKTSLDELPQLFNVLCGEMSLVGPRPVVEAEKVYYGDIWADYLSVRPGMTGLWQVSGRNDVGYEQRVELDRRYVRQWSLAGDFVIMLRTVFVVLGRRGAY